MSHGHGPAERLAGERNQVAAAILLVAGGRYPRVIVANLPDAAAIAAELEPDARRRGVELTVPEHATAPSLDIVVRRQ